MSVPNCSRFLVECITCCPDKQPGLREDEVYGLYLSWCFLNGEEPIASASLWIAMRRQTRVEPYVRGGQLVWPGLSMTGPAALDYILSSQPSLV
ncbi:hypothetical protein [Arthrobacter sp. P2b]|jgi:hypothetical protein|uniref:hypothetical protein n=1 Tax=Arthrobacter sp. P2b TaxID=1938741 RepID=UPI0009A5D4AF|nr:hypothetical protein [Arthrobacter sp. P2b]SLK13899.1 hypothetical protein SAMN06272721_11964 [Arthrobacter sp. P2b]